ncbi:MAG: hypothetical protein B7X04_00440 [Parcubacteria group bacterium 21-54-25]|nr:MAG: hypothetical protein B7X04_00440 [Parcubacteria group bacterium 21-54-25]HQU07476.1 hypothetical protein [Candidatus Paceibacterota bacterium]
MSSFRELYTQHKKEVLVWGALIVVAIIVAIALGVTQLTTRGPSDGFAAWRAALIKDTTTVSGTVTRISTTTPDSGTITLATTLIDLQDPSLRSAYDRLLVARRLGGAGGPSPLGPFSLPRKKVTLAIAFSTATKFNAKALSGIHSGDIVGIDLTGSAYATSTPLTARTVTYINPIQQAITAETQSALGNTHELFGTVTAVNHTSAGTVLSVRAKVVDQAKLATTLKTNVATSSYAYTVPYVEKPYTVTVPASATVTGTFAVGTLVCVSATESIYSTSRLTASALTVLSP